MWGLHCITVELPAGLCIRVKITLKLRPPQRMEFQGDFDSDQAVIGPTVSSTHGSGDAHLLPVSLVDNDSIKEV